MLFDSLQEESKHILLIFKGESLMGKVIFPSLFFIFLIICMKVRASAFPLLFTSLNDITTATQYLKTHQLGEIMF
jgi:hypothetical protein